MMRRLSTGLLAAIVLTGCAIEGHFYPVQGPLTAQTPSPIYQLTLQAGLTSGSMTTTLQDGEICTGKWSLVTQEDPTASQMAAVWDTIYGPGFFVANILGSKGFARAVLTGTRGTTLNVEFHIPGASPALPEARGIAKDNKGDIFKMTLGGPAASPAYNIPRKQPPPRTQEITS
jgi:hypothetical protein